MISVKPPDEVNPYEEFDQCMKKSAILYEHKLYNNAPPQGMENLRKILCKYLSISHIITTPENIVITNGAQQALYILATMKIQKNVLWFW